MWFWQRKSTRKRFLFWAQLATVSTTMHFLVLLLFFAFYRDPFSVLAFTIRPDKSASDVAFSINIEDLPVPIKEKPTETKQAMALPEPVTQKVVQQEKKKVEEPKKKEVPPGEEKSEPIPIKVAELYKQVSQKWTPPPGVPSDAECELLIQVDWHGGIIDTSMKKSSGILLFDLAAQAAIDELECPKWAWGKAIALTFSMEMT